MNNDDIKETFIELFEKSESVKKLPVSKREELKTRILGLPNDQLASLVNTLQEESAKVSAYKAKLDVQCNEIANMLGNSKEAKHSFARTIRKITEQQEEKDNNARTEQLLDKIP
jgi:hypothetical protein